MAYKFILYLENPVKPEIKMDDLGVPPWIGNLHSWSKPSLQG